MQEYNALIIIDGEERNEYKVKVINNFNDKTIYYVEDDKLKTVNIFDYQNNILKRDNEEIYLEIKFDKDKITNNYLLMKELDKKIVLDIKTTFIDINENKIMIKYILNDIEYTYEIIKEGEV